MTNMNGQQSQPRRERSLHLSEMKTWVFIREANTLTQLKFWLRARGIDNLTEEENDDLNGSQ